MDSLLDLRDLIIGRVDKARRIPANVTAILSANTPVTSLEDELQLNRAIIRLLTAMKRKEKERAEAEEHFLD